MGAIINKKDMTPILIKDLGMVYKGKTVKKRCRYGLFKCQYCGKEFKTSLEGVKRGAVKSKSCGCLIEKRRRTHGAIKHGLTNHRFYPLWITMMGKCYTPSNNEYSKYGKKGIIVCDEWQDAKNFVEWAEGNCIKGGDLDRIEENGNYEPSNCRWVGKVLAKVKQKNNTSGYVGVSWYKSLGKWASQIRINKKNKYLGSFKDKMDAVKARDEYIIENNLPHKLSTDY